jgi:molybdopterin converting factor small subunit
MQVAVRYMAQLRQAAGTSSESVALDGPCSVRQLVLILAERHGRPLRDLLLDAGGAVQPTTLVFVGDRQVDWEAPPTLRDGDQVTLLSPMAGG